MLKTTTRNQGSHARQKNTNLISLSAGSRGTLCVILLRLSGQGLTARNMRDIWNVGSFSILTRMCFAHKFGCRKNHSRSLFWLITFFKQQKYPVGMTKRVIHGKLLRKLYTFDNDGCEKKCHKGRKKRFKIKRVNKSN